MILAAAAVLAVAISVPRILSRLRPESPDPAVQHVPPEVAAVHAERHEGRITVSGYGSVRPLREITLIAEVAGKVTWTADGFVTGGMFREGQELLRIDSVDYANAVTIARAEVVQRQLDVLRAEEESAIAREEWSRLEDRTGDVGQPDSTELGSLVFREPQWQAAAALLESARARLQDAEARLQRTRITAPFNGRIRTIGADLGQVVGPGQVVAAFYGTDVAEIDVAVAGRDVALLGDVLGGGARRTRATVVAAHAGGVHEWEGYVHRTEGALSEASRTLNAVIRVLRPYETDGQRPPLLVGTYVTAHLEGRQFDVYYTLPRGALRQGAAVWVVEDGRLRIRSVEIIQEVEDTVYVSGGITEEDAVVTGTLDAVTDGMQVQLITQ